MRKIKEVIVVEGKSDKQFLETFLDADILTCNGSAIDGFDIEYLKTLENERGIIILTDPDYPGERIRNEISSKLNRCKHAFVRKKYAIKHHKVGVAEASKEEVLNALSNMITYDSQNVGDLTSTDLFFLNLIGNNSTKNKEKVCDYYHLGHCNGKTLLKRLNMLHISKEELEKLIDD
ncbi:MAG: ribonuclease M5 [Erysipelotrichaceae bacterium]|nr:ribonuclease M5 [Erysipelotrichaceae bacterium]